MEDLNQDLKLYIEGYIGRARKAQSAFEQMSQEDVDRAVMMVGKVIYDNSERLAELAVAETGMGNAKDKTKKNKSKSRMIWHSMKGVKSRGVIERDEATGITKVAKPVGVVAAITPVTNPIVTPMSNAMFALKGGNAIIFAPHHNAQKCSGETIELIRAALARADVPVDLVQMLSEHSRELTRELISSADVVVATGGAGMVRAAYSSGRPAYGVGAGNVQCIVDRGMDAPAVARMVIDGRAYDNGIICSSEQAVIIPDDEYEAYWEAFENAGAAVVRIPAVKKAYRDALFPDGKMLKEAVGRDAQDIAALAGQTIQPDARVIIIEADGHGKEDILSKEKMFPVLTVYCYHDFEEAIEIASANLELDGKGHSVAIHSHDRANIELAADKIAASRFIVGQTSAFSAGGSFSNGLAPTNTLGCGSWGGNSISENFTWKHLVNISRIADVIDGVAEPSDEELWQL